MGAKVTMMGEIWVTGLGENRLRIYYEALTLTDVRNGISTAA
jgi:hypothetical protein